MQPSYSSKLATTERHTVRDVLGETMEKHRGDPLTHQLVLRGLGPYRSYAEILQSIDDLAERGARISVIGRSVRGEPLVAVELGNPSPSRYTRTTVILSAIHPLEWIGVEVHLAILRRLAGMDLGDRAVISMPLVNPDGFLKVEKNIRQHRWRLVRHNARGVDLNRNFDSRWGEKSHLSRLIPQMFRVGSHAASEPEVLSVVRMLSHRRVDRALSLHSFGGAILYPRAGRLLPIADVAEHRLWARAINASLTHQKYRVLQCSMFSMGMTQGGLELDWFHQRHGAISLLIECSGGLTGLNPSRLLEPFAWFNTPLVHETSEDIAAAVEPFVCGEPLPES